MDFKQAEKEFKRLKDQFEAGSLTKTEFETQLEDLMIQDKQGTWWMMGYETGLWYRHDGTNWVQANLSGASTQISIPSWAVVFWIMLGWAAGSAIGIGISSAMGEDISGNISLATGGAISGAIGGFSIATTLRVQNIISDWESMLWITLAWLISSSIGWTITVAIGWIFGGIATAAMLGVKNTISDWRSLVWVILAWAISPTIGWEITAPIQKAIGGDIGWVIGWAVSGALGGAIGGSVMVWQIREAKK